MKNKPLTYLLGIMVLIIWGTIIYRVITAYHASDSSESPVAPPVKKAAYNDYAIKADSAPLNLRYRDPFYPQPVKVAADSTAKNVKTITVRANSVTPALNWPSVHYLGFIKNPDSKKIVALLAVDNKNLMMTEGEEQEDIKLVKNMLDCIKIQWKGSTRLVTMNTTSR